MPDKAGLRACALGAAIAVLLGVAGAAIAAGNPAPTLLAPNHQRVAPGRVRLVVEVPLAAAKHAVFVTIATKRRLDRFGHLKECSANGCDFVGPTHWKGERYSYVAPFNFPGYWSVTPGRYYWQAHYYTVGDTAVYWSGVGSFVVK